MITINPLILDNPEHNKILAALLATDDDVAWLNGRTYKVGEQKICLTHDIHRTDYDRTDYEEGNASYYVFSNEVLGRGRFSEVIVIECVLSLSAGKIIASEDNALVAKIHNTIPISSREEYEKIYNEYMRQYQLNLRTPHIGMRKPIFTEIVVESEDGNCRYEIQPIFIMKKMEGEEFFESIYRRYERRDIASIRDLLTISRVLLRNFNEQFVKNNILHGDIKPENINLDFDAQHDIQLNIFDIGNVSQEYGAVITRPGGTKYYVAPEAQVIGTAITDEKIDMFSIGVTLQAIWGFGYEPLPTTESGREKKIAAIIGYFFPEDPMATHILPLVYDAVIQMTAADPIVRSSIKDAIQAFEYMTIKVAELVLSVTPQSVASPPSRDMTPSWSDFKAKSSLHQAIGVAWSQFFRPVTPISPGRGVLLSPINHIKNEESSEGYQYKQN